MITQVRLALTHSLIHSLSDVNCKNTTFKSQILSYCSLKLLYFRLIFRFTNLDHFYHIVNGSNVMQVIASPLFRNAEILSEHLKSPP